MKFLLLLHGDAAAEAAMTDDERRAIVDQHIAFGRHLAERGAHIFDAALGPPEGGAHDPRRRRPAPGHRWAVPRVEGGPRRLLRPRGGSIEEATELVRPVPRSPGLVAQLLPIVDM